MRDSDRLMIGEQHDDWDSKEASQDVVRGDVTTVFQLAKPTSDDLDVVWDISCIIKFCRNERLYQSSVACIMSMRNSESSIVRSRYYKTDPLTPLFLITFS